MQYVSYHVGIEVEILFMLGLYFENILDIFWFTHSRRLPYTNTIISARGVIYLVI
jgi:hypothetical protein